MLQQAPCAGVGGALWVYRRCVPTRRRRRSRCFAGPTVPNYYQWDHDKDTVGDVGGTVPSVHAAVWCVLVSREEGGWCRNSTSPTSVARAYQCAGAGPAPVPCLGRPATTAPEYTTRCKPTRTVTASATSACPRAWCVVLPLVAPEIIIHFACVRLLGRAAWATVSRGKTLAGATTARPCTIPINWTVPALASAMRT